MKKFAIAVVCITVISVVLGLPFRMDYDTIKRTAEEVISPGNDIIQQDVSVAKAIISYYDLYQYGDTIRVYAKYGQTGQIIVGGAPVNVIRPSGVKIWLENVDTGERVMIAENVSTGVRKNIINRLKFFETPEFPATFEWLEPIVMLFALVVGTLVNIVFMLFDVITIALSLIYAVLYLIGF